MTNAIVSTRTPTAWRSQPGESALEHLRFLHWAFCDGELSPSLASRFHWTERRNLIEAYERLAEIPPGEQALEAAIAQASVIYMEAHKLRSRVLEDPDNVLTPTEIQKGLEWLTSVSIDYAARKANAMSWETLTPEEREVMLKAKRIQDRLLGKE